MKGTIIPYIARKACFHSFFFNSFFHLVAIFPPLRFGHAHFPQNMENKLFACLCPTSQNSIKIRILRFQKYQANLSSRQIAKCKPIQTHTYYPFQFSIAFTLQSLFFLFLKLPLLPSHSFCGPLVHIMFLPTNHLSILWFIIHLFS